MSRMRTAVAEPAREKKATTGQNSRHERDQAGTPQQSRWAVILAGGDGKRLLPLTRRISGDDRPKQFCRLLGGETLLDQTRRRVSRVVGEGHIFSLVTKSHEHFYSHQDRAGLLIQPANRGTAPAIAYGLTHIRELAPEATLGFFPSDHYFADDEAFTACVSEAFDFAEQHPERVVLLGIAPGAPETQYGWIEPGEPVRELQSSTMFSVRSFWEKPTAAAAMELMSRGGVWNSFILIGRVEAFANLLLHSVPALLQCFESAGPHLADPGNEESLACLYSAMEASCFSTDVLGACARTAPGMLLVACSAQLEWADVGEVRRALSLIGRKHPPERTGATPQVMSAAG